MIFGRGLVETENDFGIQGTLPTHPELLDWLAVEFVASGWDIKALLRQIVCTATYRQSSRASADLLRRDPDNRLLARGARFRLSAQALVPQKHLFHGRERLLADREGRVVRLVHHRHHRSQHHPRRG